MIVRLTGRKVSLLLVTSRSSYLTMMITFLAVIPMKKKVKMSTLIGDKF